MKAQASRPEAAVRTAATTMAASSFYQGQTIERLDVAALGSGAPVPPGIAKLPRPGQYYASPALAALLRTVIFIYGQGPRHPQLPRPLTRAMKE